MVAQLKTNEEFRKALKYLSLVAQNIVPSPYEGVKINKSSPHWTAAKTKCAPPQKSPQCRIKLLSHAIM